MTVNEALRIVRGRWRVVLLCLLLGLLGAAVVTSRMPREYSSNVTFYVSLQGRADTSDAAYQASQIAKQRVVSYAPLLSDERVTKAVVDKLQLPVTPQQLADRITVTVEPETVVLSASVTDTSPEQAATVANALADEFVGLVQELEQPIGPDPAPAPAGQPAREATKMGVQTIRPASVPLTPVSPNVPFNLALGAALGLLVGVAGAFVRNARDTSVRSAERLRELTGAPVLTEVPLDRDARLHPLTLGASPDSAHVEAFRRLRTNLQFLDRPHRVMVVTSAVSGEGSTTTACNLALALADAGYRVLLVDLNLRRPSVRRYMELPPGPGVADVLAGRASMQQALRRWIVGGLDVLPAGPVPPNSSELLASPAADAMLDDLGKHYSYVILDVPALLPVADAAAVAARADGAVLVVRYGKTSEEQVAGAVSALGVVQAPVLGIALTGTPAPRRRRRSRPYPRYEQGPQQPHQAQRAQAQPQVPADDTPTSYLQIPEPQAASTAQEAQPQPGASAETAEQPSPDESSDAASTASAASTAPQNGAVERPSPTRRS